MISLLLSTYLIHLKPYLFIVNVIIISIPYFSFNGPIMENLERLRVNTAILNNIFFKTNIIIIIFI